MATLTKSSKVRVILRVRPFLDHEKPASKNPNPTPCISLLHNHNDQVSVLLKDQETSRSESYELDSYFDGQNDTVFDTEVKCLIPGIFHGCNATVFAYGATSSGKTFTMQGTNEQPGLMMLAMSTVLSMCQATGNTAAISYYEVYLDRCYDLLEFKAKEISVLDDKEGQIHLRGLSSVPVNSLSEFHDVFTRGLFRRKVAHTGLNDVSSRSHGVLVISVAAPSDKGLPGSIVGKINLIDLAGNEDNKRSGNEGIRLQESAKINQSLFALSNVIYALNNNKPRVPYRESKLTRILQDSLGGKSRSLMVACVSPGDYQAAVHTVNLAARSRHISNALPTAEKQETPKVRIDMEAKLRVWLETKGKSKSNRGMDAFGSPFFLKTPGRESSMKKRVVHPSSVKDKAAYNETPNVLNSRFVPQRIMFENEDTSDLETQVHPSSVKDKAAYNETPNVLNRFVPQRIMFENEDTSDLETQELKGLKECKLSSEDHMHHEHELAAPDFVNSRRCFPQVKGSAEDFASIECILNGSRFESTVRLPDELLEEDERANNRVDILMQSPANRPQIISCQNPLRKALTPIDSNISNMSINEVSSRDNVLAALLEPDTMKTPFIGTEEKLRDFRTPLDKFTACSSNLKNHLEQEYIDFLNSATREELVELKGIGVKRAEYITELRETSPLKSLSDLEKIGLSSKQVHHLFSKAAKVIFG